MRDEWSGVNLSRFNQAKDFLAIASIHATGLEGEILAIHVWQRKNLRLVIKGYNGNYGIRTGTLPRQAEGIVGSSHLEHSIGSSVVAMFQYKLITFFRSSEQYIGIMFLHKPSSFF